MSAPIETASLVGRYRVIGGHPVAGYRALDLVEGTRVHLDVAPATEWRERSIQYLRAASIVRLLDHAGVARIHGRGVLPDRRPWIASELAEGVALCDVLARRLLAVDETVALVRDLAEVVAHAHARGVVHGAIRPHLVVLRTGDKPYAIQLGGWGDLRAPGHADHVPARTAYSAPELIHDSFDGRADVYAIGVLAHRALTGRFPGPVAPELVSGVPGRVSALVVHMLATDPALRWTAGEVLVDATALTGDRVVAGPRFAHPRWTPAPLPGGERLADVVDLATARRVRS